MPSLEERIEILATLVSALLNELPENGPDWDQLKVLAERVRAGERCIEE